MLVPSPKHTPADMRLWAEMEEADRAHGKSMRLHRDIGRSIAAIQRFAAAGPCYAAISFGKDSVVLAGLIREAKANIPLAWIRVRPICNPDCMAVRDSLFWNWPDHPQYHEIAVQCARDEAGWHATGTLEAGAAEARRRIGTGRCLLGIRAAESSSRKLSAFVHGESTETKCRPLLWWKPEDVFAYLASRDLPVHPAYAMLGGGRWDRHHLRVSSLGGKRGDGMGRAEWEQEYYRDELNRIRATI